MEEEKSLMMMRIQSLERKMEENTKIFQDIKQNLGSIVTHQSRLEEEIQRQKEQRELKLMEMKAEKELIVEDQDLLHEKVEGLTEVLEDQEPGVYLQEGSGAGQDLDLHDGEHQVELRKGEEGENLPVIVQMGEGITSTNGEKEEKKIQPKKKKIQPKKKMMLKEGKDQQVNRSVKNTPVQILTLIVVQQLVINYLV